MSRKRHAVQRLRKLHRSFGAGLRQGLSCDHDWWTNASLRPEFTLRVKCSVSRALDGFLSPAPTFQVRRLRAGR